MNKKTAVLLITVLLTAVGLPHAALFELADTGTEEIINYEKYGRFENEGTDKYKYTITDSKGLASAAGEGIFPNTKSVLSDPGYMKANGGGKLKGSVWNFTNSDDYRSNFYKWATVAEEPGTKLYYVAYALEKAGLLKQAVKAYYALLVHFPKSRGLTYWGTPWYMGPVALDKINFLCRENPELSMKLSGASISVENSFDDSLRNDVFIVNPGRLEWAVSQKTSVPESDLSGLEVVKTVGAGRVKLLKYSNHHWQLTVDGEPFSIRGIAYMPNKVGLSPDKGTLNVHKDWMYWDFNKNGKNDTAYDSWVDLNRNNKKDQGETAVGDFQLMKDLGVNTLRLYDHRGFNKELLMKGHEEYGFMYLVGDPIGNYAIGSGADWFTGTDYTNPVHKKNMLENLRKMVEEFRDEPYVLMWVLGNENNYSEPGVEGVSSGNGCRAKIQPEAYYAFVNEAAMLVKSLDPQKRPVAVCNGDTLYLDICARLATELDVFGANAYRGEQGFGSVWRDVEKVFDKPVLITEYGCSAYHPDWTNEKAEAGQARYIKYNWLDIERNLAGRGQGNALGGILFEWVDEWWKANSDLPVKIQQQNKEWYLKRSKMYKNLKPYKQDTVPQFGAPFLDGWSYEEWFGITSQGNGKKSPFLRQLRPAYYELQKLWENN